jgi:hypothetical protein
MQHQRFDVGSSRESELEAMSRRVMMAGTAGGRNLGVIARNLFCIAASARDYPE